MEDEYQLEKPKSLLEISIKLLKFLILKMRFYQILKKMKPLQGYS